MRNYTAAHESRQIIGLSPPACLTVAVASSGFYVRNGRSPSLFEIENFIRNF